LPPATCEQEKLKALENLRKLRRASKRTPKALARICGERCLHGCLTARGPPAGCHHCVGQKRILNEAAPRGGRRHLQRPQLAKYRGVSPQPERPRTSRQACEPADAVSQKLHKSGAVDLEQHRHRAAIARFSSSPYACARPPAPPIESAHPVCRVADL
jgi:hypothetical protein